MGRPTASAALLMVMAGMGWAGCSLFKAEQARAFNPIGYTHQSDWKPVLQTQDRSFQTEDFNDNSSQSEIILKSAVSLIQNRLWGDERQEKQQTEERVTKPLFAWGRPFDLDGSGSQAAALLVSVLTVLENEENVRTLSNTLAGAYKGFMADAGINPVPPQPAFQGSDDAGHLVYAEADLQPTPQSVPEPTAIWGTVALGMGSITLKRKYKANRQQDKDSSSF